MSTDRVIIARVAFAATVVEWRGPAPFLFAPIPDDLTAELRFAAHEASYGWGVVPVMAAIGATRFATSLFPRSGSYLLPIKVTVQRDEAITVGNSIAATVEVVGR